jgi:ABC-type multidrug transport system fused ATPase/permease subunit
MVNNLNKFDLNKFNTLMNQANEIISCDAECVKKQKTEELNKKYLDAQSNLQNAPQILFTAKKDYITYTQGTSAYNNILEKELHQQVDKIITDFKTNFNNSVNVLNKNITTYSGLLLNFNNIADLYKKYKSENDKIEQSLKTKSSDLITNDRKTFYEDEALERIKMYYYFLLLVYIFIVVVFFVAIFLVDTNVTLFVRVGILIMLIIYPFVSFWIYTLIMQIINNIYVYLPKNFYTTL